MTSEIFTTRKDFYWAGFVWLQVFAVVVNLISLASSDWTYGNSLTADWTGEPHFSISTDDCQDSYSGCAVDHAVFGKVGIYYIFTSIASVIFLIIWTGILIKDFRNQSMGCIRIIIGGVVFVIQTTAFWLCMKLLGLRFTQEFHEETKYEKAGFGPKLAVVVILTEASLFVIECLHQIFRVRRSDIEYRIQE